MMALLRMLYGLTCQEDYQELTKDIAASVMTGHDHSECQYANDVATARKKRDKDVRNKWPRLSRWWNGPEKE